MNHRRARSSGDRLRYWRYRHRPGRIALVVGGVLFVLGAAWIVITGLLARSTLQQLNSRLQNITVAVSQGDLRRAKALSQDVPALARRAHALTSGPAWWVAAQVPVLGDPADVVRGTTDAVSRTGSDALPRLLAVTEAINPRLLRGGDGSVKLGPLVQALPQLRVAAQVIDQAATALDRLPHSTWLGAADDGRARIDSSLAVVKGYTDAADRVASILPSMLGDHGARRYFIGLQNEAEFRGTGGLPGAFAIAVADRGTVRFTTFQSDSGLEPPTPNNTIDTGLSFGADYDAAYAAALPTTTFVDSNASPNFPYAAQIWAAMWERTSGQHVDGALALDPTVLSHFLAATGPVQLAGGMVVSADNVVSLTQRDQYALFSNLNRRKQFVVDVLRATLTSVTSGSGDSLGVLQAASRSATERRLLVWSADPATEAVLQRSTFAGALPPPATPFAGLVLNNASGGKVDFYVTRELTYVRTGCGDTRDVVATIKLTNNAPASGLPAYVVGRADRPPAGARPGDVHEIVDYLSGADTQLQSVYVDGRQTTAAALRAVGRPMYRIDLELPRGQSRTIVLHLREAAGRGAPVIWQQPGVTPLAVQTYSQSCQ